MSERKLSIALPANEMGQSLKLPNTGSDTDPRVARFEWIKEAVLKRLMLISGYTNEQGLLMTVPALQIFNSFSDASFTTGDNRITSFRTPRRVPSEFFLSHRNVDLEKVTLGVAVDREGEFDNSILTNFARTLHEIGANFTQPEALQNILMSQAHIGITARIDSKIVNSEKNSFIAISASENYIVFASCFQFDGYDTHTNWRSTIVDLTKSDPREIVGALESSVRKCIGDKAALSLRTTLTNLKFGTSGTNSIRFTDLV